MKRLILLCAIVASGIAVRGAEWSELKPAVESFNVHYRVEAQKGTTFGIEVAEGDTLSVRRFELEVPAVFPDDHNNSMAVKIAFKSSVGGQWATDSTVKATVFVDKPKSVDLSMKIVGPVNNGALEVGDRAVCFSAPVEFPDTVPLYVRFFSNGKVASLRQTIEYVPKAGIRHSGFATLGELVEYLKDSTDTNEGLWNFYDRTTAPLRAAPNGEYMLATVRSDAGYDIVYIKDNENIPSDWKPLTVKGEMAGCDVPGVFDVKWIDRRGCELASRISGIIEGNLLTVNFPYWKVALRFSRINLNNFSCEQ